jgi:tetratricopeptide (TPR) repeat protein
MNLGRLYGMRGRYREALALEERAQRLRPNAPDILTDLGTTWWALGDTTRAAAYFTRAVEIGSRLIGVSPKGAQVARHAAMNLARLRANQSRGSVVAPAAVADSGSAK